MAEGQELAKTSTDDQKLRAEVSPLIVQAKAIKIIDQPTYDGAVAFLAKVKEGQRRVSDYFDLDIKRADELHKSLCAKRKPLMDGLESARKIVGAEVARFHEEEEQKRLALEQQREEAARKRAEEAALAAAADAQAHGVPPEEAERILDEAIAAPPPAPVVPPTFDRDKRVVPRKTWKARLRDMKALNRAVLEGRAPVTMLEFNQSGADTYARSTQGTVQIPGVEFYTVTSVAVRE